MKEKIKFKDLNKYQYDKLVRNGIIKSDKNSSFCGLDCSYSSEKTSCFNNKDKLSENILNQELEVETIDRKEDRFYINGLVDFCYPYKGGSATTAKFGVLRNYYGNLYTQDEIDEIICEMIKRHPYIDNSMDITITISRKFKDDDGEESSDMYKCLRFPNYNYEFQERGSMKIKYEK